MIHISTNGGENWKNVTPQNAPKYLMWNSIELIRLQKEVFTQQELFIKLEIIDHIYLKQKIMVKHGKKLIMVFLIIILQEF